MVADCEDEFRSRVWSRVLKLSVGVCDLSMGLNIRAGYGFALEWNVATECKN